MLWVIHASFDLLKAVLDSSYVLLNALDCAACSFDLDRNVDKDANGVDSFRQAECRHCECWELFWMA